MSQCLELANATILNSTTTWSQLDRASLKDVSITSYLRPDKGGALLPWVYTIIVLIVHFPVVIIRVARWEITQTWCIASTLFTVVIYIQAYVSTKFAADQVLVWTPLILVIDAGSMLQLFFLVVEARVVRIRGRQFLFEPRDGGGREATSLLGRIWGRNRVPNQGHELQPLPASIAGVEEPDPLLDPAPNNEDQEHQAHEYQALPANIAGAEEPVPLLEPAPNNEDQEPAPLWKTEVTYVAVASALLFVTVLVLQILGLQAAARKRGVIPIARWCSPLFQPFGIVAADGDCHTFPIDQSTRQGIGCIQLPGIWQRDWLTGTVVGTSLCLVFELIDLIILLSVRTSKRLNGVKMRRPWATMISGLVMLCITLFYGLQYASMLPPGITERLTVVVKVDGIKGFAGQVSSAGLRGTIIGWNDGLFEGWHSTYLGGLSH